MTSSENDRAAAGNALAIDIGGSKLTVGLVRDDGTIVAKCRRTWPRIESANELVDAVVASVSDLREETPQDTIREIGATVPGLANAERGLWVYAPFSGIENIDFADRLGRRLGAPVVLDNDVNAAAVAEREFGACVREDDFLWVTLSNGVGGALFLRGELYRGWSGFAGEIGHTVAVPDGEVDDAGIAGALEEYASGRAIAARYARDTGASAPVPADAVAKRARAGDEAARAVYATVGECLGSVLAGAINLLNLPLIVFGGGVSNSFDLFVPTLKRRTAANVFARANPGPRFICSRFPEDAPLLGAAALAFAAARSRSPGAGSAAVRR